MAVETNLRKACGGRLFWHEEGLFSTICDKAVPLATTAINRSAQSDLAANIASLCVLQMSKNISKNDERFEERIFRSCVSARQNRC